MTEEVFRAKRRQQFLTKKYYSLNGSLLERELDLDARATAEGVLPPTDVSYTDIPGSAFKGAMKLLRLHYTAGEPIESLKPLFAAAMKWFGEWHVAYGAQIQHLAQTSGEELRTDGSPVYMEDLFHCQLAMELVSFGILLGEADAVRRVAAWLGRYRNAFSAVPATLALTPRWAPRPAALAQVARVVGLDDAVVHTDRDARVKVQFARQRGEPSGQSHRRPRRRHYRVLP